MDGTARPKDIIDTIEALAAQSGHFDAVDEDYYHAFLELAQQEIEKLAVAVMLDQEKEVRRLARANSDPTAVARVSKFIHNFFRAISLGLARFDAFGRLGFVARIGPEPSIETDDLMDCRFKQIEPIVTNTVRRTLPWLLSREVTQSQLPL